VVEIMVAANDHQTVRAGYLSVTSCLFWISLQSDVCMM